MSARAAPHPPSPARFAALRLPGARRDPVGFLRSLGALEHDAVSFRFGRRRVIVLNDPALIREVLVVLNDHFSKAFLRGVTWQLMGESIFASDGAHHDRQRVAMVRAVRHDQFEPLPAKTYAAVARRLSAWPHEGEVDAAEEMRRLSMHVTCLNLFGGVSAAEEEALLRALEGTIASYDRAVTATRPLLDALPLASTKAIRAGTRALRAWVEARVDERLAPESTHADILAALVAQRYADGGPDRLTRKQLLDECVDLIIGAHETVAAGLGWTLHLLAKDADLQRRLRAEMAGALSGRPPTLTDLARLDLLRRTVRESFRIFPPSWGFLRLAKDNVRVGPYRVAAGSVLVLSPALTHNDPRYFPDPERFDPDRWLPERQSEMVKEAYFPFGAGARSCIGEPIALAEVAAALCAILPRFELQSAGGPAPHMRPRMALEPAGEICIRVRALAAGSEALASLPVAPLRVQK